MRHSTTHSVLSSQTLCRVCEQSDYQLRCIGSQSLRNKYELHHPHLPLPALVVRNERLRPAELLPQLTLREPGGVARFGERLAEAQCQDVAFVCLRRHAEAGIRKLDIFKNVVSLDHSSQRASRCTKTNGAWARSLLPCPTTVPEVAT